MSILLANEWSGIGNVLPFLLFIFIILNIHIVHTGNSTHLDIRVGTSLHKMFD
jgi:hypothetical protein